MIATNAVAPISHMLKSLILKIREEVRMKAEFGGDREPKRADQDVIVSIEQTLREADDALLPLLHEESEIQADPDTSDVGKVKRMIEAVGRAYERLRFVGKKAKEKRAASLAAAEVLRAVPEAPSGDVMVDALVGYEIRQRLGILPEAERMKVFANAVTTGNRSIERAVLNDPFAGDLLPPEFVARIRTQHLQDTRTKEWRRMETLEFAAERLEILAGAVEANLGTYGKPVTFQPRRVRESDLGTENQQSPPPQGPADQPAAPVSSFQ